MAAGCRARASSSTRTPTSRPSARCSGASAADTASSSATPSSAWTAIERRSPSSRRSPASTTPFSPSTKPTPPASSTTTRRSTCASEPWEKRSADSAPTWPRRRQRSSSSRNGRAASSSRPPCPSRSSPPLTPRSIGSGPTTGAPASPRSPKTAATCTSGAALPEYRRTSFRCTSAKEIRAGPWPPARHCSSAGSSCRESARRRCRRQAPGSASRSWQPILAPSSILRSPLSTSCAITSPEEALMNLSEKDRRYVWHPFTQMRDWTAAEPLIIARAEGNELIDTDGRRYLDGVSSLWVNLHGHHRRELDDAVRAQLDRVAHSTLLGLANVPSIELAERLVKIAPPGLSRVFYSDSGSTAVEVALKIAFQYQKQRGHAEKRKFLALTDAYHG